ncbi:MAG: glycosyltransferase [Planctomyces sp.]
MKSSEPLRTPTSTARIRVVCSIGAMHGGGSERQMVSILRHLDRTRFEPFLYLVYRSGPLLNLIPDDVPVVSFEERTKTSRFYLPGLMHRRRVRDMASYLKEIGAEVSYDRTFLMTLISADAAQRAGVPNVSTIVTDPETGFAPVAGRFQWLKRRILHRLYNRSFQVLAVSDGARQAATRFYGIRPEKIITHRNGIDTDWVIQQSLRAVDDAWWQQNATSENSLRIVTAGRLNEQKGFHFLIDAVSQLCRALPERNIRLAILGEGPWRDILQNRINEKHLQGQVKLAGFRDDAAAWYRSADLFVLPSLIEGMPNVLLEAMACGTPVISSDCHSGPSEILKGGALGELVPPGDSDSLFQAMLRSVQDSAAARRRADLALEAVRKEFSIQSAVSRLEAVLESAAKSAVR